MSISDATVDLLGGKARLLSCQPIEDERGTLTPLHFEPLGFEVRRMALISAPDGSIRGGHSHRAGTQILVCVSGSVDVTLRYLGEQVQVTLEPGVNLLMVDAPVWARQVYRGTSARLLVLGDVDYSPELYSDRETEIAASSDG